MIKIKEQVSKYAAAEKFKSAKRRSVTMEV